MTRLRSLLLSASLALASILSASEVSQSALVAAASTAKSTKSTKSTKANPKISVIVTMKERVDAVLDDIKTRTYSSSGKRATAMRDGLASHAQRTQQDVFGVLKKAGAAFTRSESFWLTNQVFVEGATPELIAKLLKLPSVQSVLPELILPLVFPTLETSATTTASTNTQWGVSKIRAPDVWATGSTGKGVVVGIIDTGARYTHKDIASSFRQSFGWFDPELKIATPYDTTGHGTHVAGTIAGANGIGVAPGVTWIMCKGCRANGCYASDLLACFQFMTCPTTPDGLTKDCSKQPDVVNNSWGAGQGLTLFDTVIATWHANQIIPVFAAGNAGPACTTISSPGDKANVISVGATTDTDGLAYFSSKGPTVNGLRKPDVLAPGLSITSSCFTGDADYCVKSGTSMATPHVVGMIALYLSRYPPPVIATTRTLTENDAPYVDVVKALRGAALTSVLTQSSGYTCGNTLDQVFPNNQFGFGRLDAMKLLSIVPNYVTSTTPIPTATTPAPTTSAPTTPTPTTVVPTTPTPTTTAPKTPTPTTASPTTPIPTPTTPAPTTQVPSTVPPTTPTPTTATPTPTTVAPTPPTAAPITTYTCKLEVGVDYISCDIGNAPASTASACCAICAARVGCKAFSWNNYLGGTCWLKNMKASTAGNAGVTSGTLS